MTAQNIVSEMSGFFRHPGEQHEARIFRAGGRIDSYLVGNAEEVAAVVEAQEYEAAYITLNPVRLNLKGAANASDVVLRRWILFDLDPIRPPHTNATDDELLAAAKAGCRLRSELLSHGWPAPRMAWSGNGVHCLVPVDLPNDAHSTQLVQAVLKAAAAVLDTPTVRVDSGVYDAPRIARILGTINRKGRTPTAERPHRLAAIWNEQGDQP